MLTTKTSLKTDAAGPAESDSDSDPTEQMTAKQRKLLARIERARSDRNTASADRPDDMFDYELPEVELVRKSLEREVTGLTIENCEAASLKCLRSYFFRKYFTNRLEGAKINKVERIGLYIAIKLESEQFDTNHVLILSLGASGSPRWMPADNKEKLKNTEVVIKFSNGNKLLFVDPVGTGQLFLVPEDDIATHIPEVADYGSDPLSPVAWTEIGQRLLQQDRELKALLKDDTFIVGIDTIYVDEILFEAGLRYDRVANTLSSQEIRRLHRSLGSTLHNAMKYGGTSLPERPFANPLGNTGGYSNHIQVWGRHDQLSVRSRDPIKRVQYQGSWTYYCDTQI